MRKFVLIAAMILASASAQAAGSRGLTLASNDEPAASAQPLPAPAAADAPKHVERPSDSKVAAQPKLDARQAAKAKKLHRETTEARVIYELHRHGIYW